MSYPLAAVLGLREREVLARKAALGAATGARSDAMREWEARRAVADALLARERATSSGEVLRAWDGGLRTRWAGRLRADATAAEARARWAASELERAGRALEAGRGELARAVRARLALEEHRSRWKRMRARERERREELGRDELAVARSGR